MTVNSLLLCRLSQCLNVLKHISGSVIIGSVYCYYFIDSHLLARAMCLAPMFLGRRAEGGDTGGAD